jgi:hypothetical protein
LNTTIEIDLNMQSENQEQRWLTMAVSNNNQHNEPVEHKKIDNDTPRTRVIKPPQKFTAGTIGQVYDCIDMISRHFREKGNEECNGNSKYPLLWYRAHREQTWQLSPTLFRDFEPKGYGYTALNLKEDYRIHGFVARARHIITDKPGNRLEWLEVMQHHFTQTRLMDWTESIDIALTFALEEFLDPDQNDKELDIRRRNMTPCIWILNPYLLNSKVYDALSTGVGLVRDALKEHLSAIKSNRLRRKLEDNKGRFYGKNDAPEFDPYLSGLINLSAIEDLRQANQSRLNQMLENEQFNPFFYLLARYYIDGIQVAVEDLPPLAIVHPYHSNRIRQQKGAFTIFPYYKWRDEREGFYKKLGINSLAMEKQKRIKECIYQIRLTDPERIAAQLLISGKRKADIYPELENYAKDLEHKGF